MGLFWAPWDHWKFSFAFADAERWCCASLMLATQENTCGKFSGWNQEKSLLETAGHRNSTRCLPSNVGFSRNLSKLSLHPILACLYMFIKSILVESCQPQHVVVIRGNLYCILVIDEAVAEFLRIYGGFLSHGGTPKSSILIGFSIIHHPAIGVSQNLGNLAARWGRSTPPRRGWSLENVPKHWHHNEQRQPKQNGFAYNFRVCYRK